ncbi:hypothetical protein BpHYR1_047654 [Brachionus plicatilis]|uniref:Uncharacterized protein n=1 Tax=Brachionus plicatilis TaxID=10195 RepID=A0A3M7RYA3_BRAPC|nr:hypothetical protein BpHYR1_047654 [Brachionus plicatilis]
MHSMDIIRQIKTYQWPILLIIFLFHLIFFFFSGIGVGTGLVEPELMLSKIPKTNCPPISGLIDSPVLLGPSIPILTITNLLKDIRVQDPAQMLRFLLISVGDRSRGHVAGQNKKIAETVAGGESGQKRPVHLTVNDRDWPAKF